MSSPALELTVDGETFTLRFSDLTAIDAKDFRVAVGVPLTDAMSAETTDLDIIAGLVWLARRKRERGLPYLKVAKELTYDTPFDMGQSNADETADDSGEA